MSDSPPDRSEYLPWVTAMSQALQAQDEGGFRAALIGFDQLRDSAVKTGVRKVASGLQTALERFHVESRLINLAQHQVPDARMRLAHVLRLTDDAAHRTMDLVEQCAPLVEALAAEAERLWNSTEGGELQAFMALTSNSMSAMRSRLSEVLLAQGFQDLSGQIIRSVMLLVDELDAALRELVALSGAPAAAAPVIGSGAARGYGPVVPGVDHDNAVSGQQDVDALLSRLGV